MRLPEAGCNWSRILAIEIAIGLATLPGCAGASRFDAQRVESDLRAAFPIGMPWADAERRLGEMHLPGSRLTDKAAFSDMRGTCDRIPSKFYVRSIVREEAPRRIVSSALSFCFFFDDDDQLCDYFFRVEHTGP